jgi:hypothetical protein
MSLSSPGVHEIRSTHQGCLSILTKLVLLRAFWDVLAGLEGPCLAPEDTLNDMLMLTRAAISQAKECRHDGLSDTRRVVKRVYCQQRYQRDRGTRTRSSGAIMTLGAHVVPKQHLASVSSVPRLGRRYCFFLCLFRPRQYLHVTCYSPVMLRLPIRSLILHVQSTFSISMQVAEFGCAEAPHRPTT